MQTYSHFLVTALVGDRLRRRRRVAFRAFLAGGVLADVPLYLLTAWYALRRQWIATEAATGPFFGAAYDRLFFHDPLWVVSHNLFHAPLVLAAVGLAGWLLWRRGGDRGETMGFGTLWFAAGGILHTLIDTLTHHADGPLLLFPLDWSLRFRSPVSYWNPAHHAGVVATAEHLLDAAIVAYFLWLWLRSRSEAASG